jgi:hypothetical protein
MPARARTFTCHSTSMNAVNDCHSPRHCRHTDIKSTSECIQINRSPGSSSFGGSPTQSDTVLVSTLQTLNPTNPTLQTASYSSQTYDSERLFVSTLQTLSLSRGSGRGEGEGRGIRDSGSPEVGSRLNPDADGEAFVVSRDVGNGSWGNEKGGVSALVEEDVGGWGREALEEGGEREREGDRPLFLAELASFVNLKSPDPCTFRNSARHVMVHVCMLCACVLWCVTVSTCMLCVHH